MDIVFSIIVPMRNEERYVEETVLSLTRQDYPQQRFEILVVDGRSSDASRQIAARLVAAYPNIRLLDNPRLNAAGARNVGVRAARGRFIGIVDCHSFVRPDFLRRAERLFRETGTDCLGRPVELFIPTDSYLQRVIGAARMSWLGHNLVSPRYGAKRGASSPLSVGILYRREVFDRIGFFDEEFDACEDVEFNSRLERAGLRTWCDPALGCCYHQRASLPGLFRQVWRYGYWRWRLARKSPAAFHVTQAAPGAGLAMAALITLLALVRLVPWSAWGALVGLYAAVVAVASLGAARRRGFRYLPLLPLVFAGIHLGAALGFLSAAAGEVPALMHALAGTKRRRREDGKASLRANRGVTRGEFTPKAQAATPSEPDWRAEDPIAGEDAENHGPARAPEPTVN